MAALRNKKLKVRPKRKSTSRATLSDKLKSVQPRKLRRAEKISENRKAFIRAASDVIGQYGYDGASVGRIADRAGLAQGTFYLYFESRQALFDTLLPELSREATDYISARVHGVHNFFELEERGFRAFLEWLKMNPSLFRVLNEAEVAAPKAFAEHFRQIVTRYESALKRARAKGEIRNFSPKELRAIVFMLLGARNYLYLSVVKGSNGQKETPNWVVDTYMDFVRGALSGKAGGTRRQSVVEQTALSQ
jgi:AcrR family transcriptional regulator